MNKKSIIIVGTILVVGLVIAGLYGTFASSNTVSINDNIYDITLTESTEEILLPANSSKTVLYQITNTNKGKVKYGVAYTGNNIKVKVYNDSIDKETGLIDYGENKFVKLYIKNNGSTDSTVTLKVILGYENGGELTSIVPTGYSLVTDTYPNTLASYIKNLYTNAPKTVVTNNDIEYNYATSVNLMNDRLGGTTANYDAGNIRYYGAHADVNNYVDIGDRDSNGNIILYQIIGLFKDMEVTNDDGSTEVKDLVKVIRTDSIGDYSYAFHSLSSGGGANDYKYNDASFVMKFLSNNTNSEYENRNKNVVTHIAVNVPKEINDWTRSYLLKLLNIGYESEAVGGSLWWNSQSGSCYTGPNNLSSSCDFTSTGLSSIAQSKIATVKWNLGGWNSSSIYSNQIYGYERGTTVYSGNATEWIGKVALMYPSDYGYATDFSKCSETLYNYSSSTNSYACRSNDWLFNSAYQWLLTHYSSGAERAWHVYYSGNVDWDHVGFAHSVRPVFYLNSELVIESGTGLSSDPYKLG